MCAGCLRKIINSGSRDISFPGVFYRKLCGRFHSLGGSVGEGYILSATFTPPDGYHLYSKDIPLNGVEGLGRPTLLELTEYSQLHALGVLTESVKTMEPNFEPKELLVYPSGAVTLSLPIELPSGDTWLDDTVKVTFMACSASTCKPPVTGKIVPIRVPGVGVYK